MSTFIVSVITRSTSTTGLNYEDVPIAKDPPRRALSKQTSTTGISQLMDKPFLLASGKSSKN